MITLLNLAAVWPLVTGQPDQRFVWKPLIVLLIVADLLIALPVNLWPGNLITTAESTGMATWYSIATLYLWLTYWYHQHTQPVVAPDYVIVLGARVTPSGPSKTLVRRLQTAIFFCVAQPNSPKLVLTGGQGSDEPQSEAQVMAAYLKQHHIDSKQLLLEETATSTDTNFKFSQQLINHDWQQPQPPKILVITSDYHLVRSQLLAKRHHLTVSLLGSWTIPTALIPAMLREVAALLLQLKWPLIIIWLLVTWFIQSFIF
ncbi:YdcF family protein [Secundilactobacillus hailunensis]|uniref:YdcF family protein n=1 Tax=Secundilactobacillus hailunensis TaxID=2559923 RepID=A0ABW1T9Y8_9LACO|nr:YdcF family protein [Secundilactobacillus hailunensis]